MKYKKLRETGVLLIGFGGLFLLIFLLLQMLDVRKSVLNLARIFALILVLLGAALNIYAFQRYTQEKIKRND